MDTRITGQAIGVIGVLLSEIDGALYLERFGLDDLVPDERTFSPEVIAPATREEVLWLLDRGITPINPVQRAILARHGFTE